MKNLQISIKEQKSVKPSTLHLQKHGEMLELMISRSGNAISVRINNQDLIKIFDFIYA